MAQNYFCIDLGERLTKIVDCDLKNNLFNVSSIGSCETNELFYTTSSEKLIEEHAKKISSLIETLKIKKTNINLLIPDSLSYNQIIEMPRLNEKELLSAIKYQADQFIPMPIDEVNLDIEILHEYETERKILTFLSAAPKKTLERIQKTMDYAGLTINAVETETSAIGRLLPEIYKSQKNALFIKFGQGSTTLYFFDFKTKLVTFSYNLNIGFSLFLKEIRVNLGDDIQKARELLNTFGHQGADQNLTLVLTPAIKDFTSQIQRFINLIAEKRGSTIAEIFLFNEAINFNMLGEILKNSFQMPVSIFDIYPHINKNQAVDSLKNQLSLFLPSFGGNLR